MTNQRQTRNISSEFIYKKPKLSPSFQKKLTSITPTILKDKVETNVKSEKSSINFNKLMISKFENDLENLLNNLSANFSKPERIDDLDPDTSKLFNIMTEFDKHIFNGAEIINSNIGKLFKTIHFLLIQNKAKLNKAVHYLIKM